jgi:hypothetical protein
MGGGGAARLAATPPPRAARAVLAGACGPARITSFCSAPSEPCAVQRGTPDQGEGPGIVEDMRRRAETCVD